MVSARSGPQAAKQESAHGIPVFLDQLIGTLTSRQQENSCSGNSDGGIKETPHNTQVAETATRHGRDLLDQGFTLEQVVRSYGDLCQAVTHLAFETGAPIAAEEFHTFNHCLDDAIAGAVTEHAKLSALTSELVSDTLNSRLGSLAHELGNYLHTATFVVATLKAGQVPLSGATGAVLDRSLLGMRTLIDRALAEVRVTARIAPRRSAIQLARFFDRLKLSASFDSLARGTPLTIAPIAANVIVYAEPEMLAAALGHLLHNAFRFTKHNTEVRVCASVLDDRVLIDVEDRCGGLTPGATETMFSPTTVGHDGRSGLGLGLEISRRSIEANGGVLTVRNVPGTGCVFTVNLARFAPTQSGRH